MKKSILIILASIFLSYPISLMGAGYETPHEFKAGDTISAEMMNELFEYIKNGQKSCPASRPPQRRLRWLQTPCRRRR